MNGLALPVFLSLALLAGSVAWDWTREMRMTPCEHAQIAYERGRAELEMRGEDPDAVFPRRPSCER